jgi:hypothetical protein
MRAGFVVSLVGHVGAVMMTMLAWEARTTLAPDAGVIVPIEIVDVALESNVRALAEPVPEEEVSASEETTVASEPEPAPTPAPTPQPRRERNNEFSLSDISGMLDKQRDPGRQRQEGAAADRTQRGAGLGTEQRASFEDRARSLVDRHLQRCWRLPDDLPDPERLIVTLSFQLNRNGSLNGQPTLVRPRAVSSLDPAMNEAVRRAMSAVRQCDPFPLADDPVVGEHFEIWREQEVTFRRRQ